jgi:hypothetical protein
MYSDNTISQIEKDLMLSYVRQLYEAVLMDDDFKVSQVLTDISKNNTNSYQAEIEKIHKAEEVIIENPKVEEINLVKVDELPKVIESVKVERKIEMVEPQAEKKDVSVTVVHEKKVELASSKHDDHLQQYKTMEHSPSIERIFTEKKKTELSDKLFETKIEDLTKAFGLNDKILSANQLFGGSMDLFQQTLQKINAFENYEEAKTLLKSYAGQYNWIRDEDSLEQADLFLRLVRRRFK